MDSLATRPWRSDTAELAHCQACARAALERRRGRRAQTREWLRAAHTLA
jgi:hypothetical protein